MLPIWFLIFVVATLVAGLAYKWLNHKPIPKPVPLPSTTTTTTVSADPVPIPPPPPPYFSLPYLMILKEIDMDKVYVTVGFEKFYCPEAVCQFQQVFDAETNYRIEVTVQPSERPDVPISILDGNGQLVASCPNCTTLTTEANSGKEGITIVVGT